MSEAVKTETSSWLNRSTVGVALASLFSDVGHEMATAVLPAVLLAIGAGPAALGLIEGTADALSSIAKLWGGYMTDRVASRKPLASIGYLVTALGVSAIGFCTNAVQVLLLRSAAWIGRGSRSAARDVLMFEAAPVASSGKAFGMERAGDALGAVLGPLLALFLLNAGEEPRHILIWSLIPGLLAFLSITFIVVEKKTLKERTPHRFLASVRATGPAFQHYLGGILVFGAGDFSRTLLILYALQHLQGPVFSWATATTAVALYILHNAVSATAALPLGALGDRIGYRRLIIPGYLFAALTTVGFALLPPTPLVLMLLFVASGVYIACEEVAEKAYARVLLPTETKGMGMGLLATTNGIGDFLSSALVGLLWARFPATPAIGFIAAAVLQATGAAVIATVPAGRTGAK